jgi:predicted HTH transcriptional regulator
MPTENSNLKLRVFVSSVQKELSEERMQLKVLLSSDPFLLRHSVPILFEKYPASLKPDKKAYLKLLDKCQIYVLIIGQQYGASKGRSATHIEYDRAQELKLPTLVCVKGDHSFEREASEVAFFDQIKDDGFTYSRFDNLKELHTAVRERLIEHIQETYELTPSKDDKTIAETTLSVASIFDRQRVSGLKLSDLKTSHLTDLAKALDPESRKQLKPQVREQLLLERGYLWFNHPKDAACPTAAGLLLSAKDPTVTFPQARVQLDLYQGMDRDEEAVIAKPLHLNIPDLIDTIVATIFQNTRTTPRVVGLKRLELNEYPEVALREALVNALAHRDYEDSSQRVFVEVFFDRIVITNPGEPVGHPSLKKLEAGKARSRSRNPLISQGLVFLRRMEERGTGIRRMRNAMLDHGLDAPQVALDDDSFVLTLPGPADDLSRIRTPEATDLSLPPSVTDELNKRQIRIAQRLVSGENLSSAELQKDFQVTRDTIARDMSLLIELKLAQKTGQARATRYIHGSANRQVSSDEI